MKTVFVGKFDKSVIADSKCYMPTYLLGYTDSLNFLNKSWTKIEWKVLHETEDKVYIVAVVYSGEDMDYRISYWLDINTGKIENFHGAFINRTLFTSANAFNTTPLAIERDYYRYGFNCAHELNNFFKKNNDIAYERALKIFELRGSLTLDDKIDIQQSAAEQSEKSDPKLNSSSTYIYTDPTYIPDTDVTLSDLTQGSSQGNRKYNSHINEWQVHGFSYVRKSGKVVNVKPHVRKRRDTSKTV